MLDADKLAQLVVQLSENGVSFTDGLTDSQIETLEQEGNFKFPPDLRAFLHYRVPISHKHIYRDYIDKSFPDWHANPNHVIQKAKEDILDSFYFDVEHNILWFSEWGERPTDLQKAFEIVRQQLETVPVMIPIYGHRYIPTVPHLAGNPVFSMVQPHDVIYYGRDLENYLLHEFIDQDRDWSELSDHRQIPFWSQFVS